MAFDGITVAALTKELSDKLTGARISKIIQPETDALLLTVKAFDGQYRLFLSASASLPLVYITQQNKTAPATAPGFCMLLRKHIGGGRITSISQPGLERVIRFEIEHLDEMGDLCHKSLVVELMGKHSNIIFCDEKDMILDSIKHISAQTSSVREVLPGRDYFIPQTMHKCDPFHTNEEEFAETVFSKPEPLAKSLYTSYTGISPVIAEELCFRSGLESQISANVRSDNEKVHLFHLFGLMMDDVREGAFTPNIITQDDTPVEFSALSLTMYADLTCETYPSMSEVLERYYAMKELTTRIRQKSADLRHVTMTALERVSKKLDLQQRQMKDTEKKDKYRLYGELLHTYGYEAKPGDKKLHVVNYYDGKEMDIPLDPQLSAAENAKKYYDRYSKLKRTAEALSVQTEATAADLAQLDSIKTFLDLAISEEDLLQVKEELMDAGYIKRHYGSTKGNGKGKPKKIKITSKPYHYRSSCGYDIYVGKNNYQNDELTFKFASGGDWWFHAKGCPGSHVLLRAGADTDLPDQAFEDAARLAAYYSANRDAAKCDIDYVRKKEVKKPNGAKPGFVVYYTNYSMTIDTDISGIELVE